MVQRKDRPWHVGVCQAFIVQCAEGAAIADHNLPDDGFEGSAKMVHRLERNGLFACGLDAERRELLQVEHLLGNCDNQDLDAINAQHNARAIRAR